VFRYVTRPPIQLERLSLAPDGKVIYALRRRWRDGPMAIQFEPFDFLARSAACRPGAAYIFDLRTNATQYAPRAHVRAHEPGPGARDSATLGP